MLKGALITVMHGVRPEVQRAAWCTNADGWPACHLLTAERQLASTTTTLQNATGRIH
jgi:hypothetical protein